MYICRRVYRLLLIYKKNNYKTMIFLILLLYPRPNFARTVSTSLGWIGFGWRLFKCHCLKNHGTFIYRMI